MDLDELRALLGAATEGAPLPWRVEHDGEVSDPDYGPEVRWPWRIVAGDAVVVDFTGGCDVSEDRAALIAAAVGALPALLEAVELIAEVAGTEECALWTGERCGSCLPCRARAWKERNR